MVTVRIVSLRLRWLRRKTRCVGCTFQVGKVQLLVNWRHHSGRVCDSDGGLATRRDMQAVALFLEMVHLALTRLGQRLLCRVDGA